MYRRWTNLRLKKRFNDVKLLSLKCLKWILKNFSSILHSQFNYHTLPVTPFKASSFMGNPVPYAKKYDIKKTCLVLLEFLFLQLPKSWLFLRSKTMPLIRIPQPNDLGQLQWFKMLNSNIFYSWGKNLVEISNDTQITSNRTVDVILGCTIGTCPIHMVPFIIWVIMWKISSFSFLEMS